MSERKKYNVLTVFLLFCFSVCADESLCDGVSTVPLPTVPLKEKISEIQPVEDTVPPPVMAQVVYLTKEQKKYSLTCDISDELDIEVGVVVSDFQTKTEIAQPAQNFFRDRLLASFMLKKGCKHQGTYDEWLKGSVDLSQYTQSTFYSKELLDFFRIRFQNKTLDDKDSVGQGFSGFSPKVVDRMCSAYRVMKWSVVDEDCFERAVVCANRARNEVFVRVPGVCVFRGVQKDFSLRRALDCGILDKKSALFPLYDAMTNAGRHSTRPEYFEFLRYNSQKLTKVSVKRDWLWLLR